MSSSIYKPRYTYDKNGSWWYVYSMTYKENTSYGEKFSGPHDKEEAIKETYRLNGWELKK